MNTPNKTIEINKILLQLSSVLQNYSNKDFSLLSGLIGKILFNINYIELSFSDKKITTDIERDIVKICELSNFKDIRYSTGISGALWFINYLNNLSVIDNNDVIDDDIRCKAIKEAINAVEKHQDYDPLHGAIGLLNFYFLENVKFDHLIISFLEKLHEISIKTENGYYWIEPAYMKTESKECCNVNLGLAHGQIGIIAFLLKCKQRNISAPILDELIHGAIAYFISTTHQIGISKMPSRVIDDAAIYAHQLAWCYGGLSSAYIILKVGKLYANEAYITYAMDLLSALANPNYYEAITLADTSLCHGTSSTAYLFGKLYKETEDIKFKIASDYWINKTCEQLNVTFNSSTILSHNEYGLLEGISGVGLVLIAYLNNFEEGSTSWDSCLYLS